MELQDFIKNLADQYDEVDANQFNADTKFKDFPEWSSLTSLSIVAMCDDEYGVTIKSADIRQADTVQALFDIVKSKK